MECPHPVTCHSSQTLSFQAQRGICGAPTRDFIWTCLILRFLGMTSMESSDDSCAYCSSGGSSKLIRLPRKPRVLQAPKAIPANIQSPPTIHAFQLRFFQRKKQIVKPASGGARSASTAKPMPAAIKAIQLELGHTTSTITKPVSNKGNTGLFLPSRTW